MSNLGNMDWVDGQVSVPGIYPVIYYVEKSKITAWPQFAAVPANAEDEVKLAGDFVLEAPTVWKRINCIDIKSEPSSEQQGEVRCKSYMNKLSVVTSLTDVESTAFAKLAANTDLVYIFQERDSGKYRVVGSEKFLTETKVNHKTGGSPTSEKGTTIEVEASDICPFPYYNGLITDGDGEVNPTEV